MQSGRRALTAGLIVGVSIHAMDAFAVQVALPSLTRDLGARDAYASVLTSYLLANVLGLVDGGRRCDQRGLVPAQAVGLLTFAVGLVMAAAAPSLPWLILGRLLQGYGGGTLATVIYAAVQKAYSRDERPMVLAWLSTAWGVGGAALPLPLGWLVDAVGWRSVFLVGLPGLLATWLLTRHALLAVPPPERTTGPSSDPPAGRASEPTLATLALVLGLALALHAPPNLGWFILPARLLGTLVAGLACASIFPPGTFTLRPTRPASIFAKITLCASYFGAEAFLPLVLEELHDYTARGVSVTLTLASVAWSVGAFAQARLLPRLGPRPLASAGLALVLFGIALLFALLLPGAPSHSVFVAWALAPLGMGFAYTTVLDAAMADTPPGEEGLTGTAVGLADSVGAASGTGFAGLLMAAAGGHETSALPRSLAVAWLGTMALGALAIAAVRRLPAAGDAPTALQGGPDEHVSP